jgi:serine/threonine protein kinase
MLTRFSSNTNTHKHLICLLTTWEQNDSFYLLFPCAQCDLLKYWADMTRNPSGASKICDNTDSTIDLVRWISEQCHGIAEGLCRIHKYTFQSPEDAPQPTERDREALYGRHGDIKPENILWFPSVGSSSRGTLVISDFGCGVFNSWRSRSKQPAEAAPNTPTYRPPEADIKGATIGRSWDIWSLGCVYLEFLTWLLGGTELFDKFCDYRLESTPRFDPEFKFDMYFSIKAVPRESEKMAVMVKPAVTKVKRTPPTIESFNYFHGNCLVTSLTDLGIFLFFSTVDRWPAQPRRLHRFRPRLPRPDPGRDDYRRVGAAQARHVRACASAAERDLRTMHQLVFNQILHREATTQARGGT